MTHRSTWLRTLHRVHAALTVCVAVTLLVLNLSGVLSGRISLLVLFTVETPLLLAFAAVTVWRFRHIDRSADSSGTSFLAQLESEEPLLRLPIFELRTFGSLILALGGKRHVPEGALAFGYTKGTFTLPTVLIVVSLIEVVIMHVLVPWAWLQIVLVLVTIWGVLFVLGIFATRVVRPHFVSEGVLHLRWGLQSVLDTPLTNISSMARYENHVHTQPHVDEDRVILTQFTSTNVLIRFAEPVVADPPVAKKKLAPGFRASEVLLYTDDPDGFVRAVERLAGSVAP